MYVHVEMPLKTSTYLFVSFVV